MKCCKRIIVCLILITVLLFNYIDVNAATTDVLQYSEVVNIAKMFVISNYKLCEDKSFKESISISYGKEIYGLDGEVCAYLIQFVDEREEDCGYIIIGATKAVPPIIEFAYEGTCFLENADKQIRSKEKIQEVSFYYNGGIDYYIGVKTKQEEMFYSVGDALTKVERDEIIISTDDGKEYESEWDNVKRVLTVNQGRGSNPPSGVIITSPTSYESGYSSLVMSTVTGGTDISYFVTNDFVANNHCGPTTAVNYLWYWYNRGYANLLQGSWTNVFNTLYANMYDFNNNTTYSGDFLDGVKWYLNTYASGYSVAQYYSNVSDWSVIAGEIDANYPVVILLQEHLKYGDHYVLGLGYREFVYNSGNSRYVLMADAWSSSPSRYVHFTVGYAADGEVCAFKIRPN